MGNAGWSAASGSPLRGKMLALMLFLAAARALTLPRLDPQRMVASWAEAQELLGLNRTAAENRELVLGFYNMSRGCGHYRHVRYVMMSKVASEEISGNMALWAHGERTDPANCTFTFVREPLRKFISGAVEMEWRFRQGQKLLGDDDMGSWRFHRLPVGSRDRAVAFLKDLLEFRWAVVPRALGHRGGLAHVYPMFGQAATWQRLVGLDFIGRLENFAADWARMQAVCGTGHVPYNSSLEIHITSSDPMHVKPGWYAALGECAVRRALCRLLSPDYETFGYACEQQVCAG